MSVKKQRDSVLVSYLCLNAAKPIELWCFVGWVHLSDSASWQNGFRQLSRTAGKKQWRDLQWQMDTELHFSTGHLAQRQCNPGERWSSVKASEQLGSSDACWRLPVPSEFLSTAIVIHSFRALMHVPVSAGTLQEYSPDFSCRWGCSSSRWQKKKAM